MQILIFLESYYEIFSPEKHENKNISTSCGVVDENEEISNNDDLNNHFCMEDFICSSEDPKQLSRLN